MDPDAGRERLRLRDSRGSPAASPSEVAQGVAGQQVWQGGAGALPIPEKEGAAGDADALLPAEVLKVRDGHRVGGPALEPFGRIHDVADLADRKSTRLNSSHLG